MRKRHNMLYGVSAEQAALDAALTPLKKYNKKNSLTRRKLEKIKNKEIISFTNSYEINENSKVERDFLNFTYLINKDKDEKKAQLIINVVDNSDDENDEDIDAKSAQTDALEIDDNDDDNEEGENEPCAIKIIGQFNKVK